MCRPTAANNSLSRLNYPLVQREKIIKNRMTNGRMNLLSEPGVGTTSDLCTLIVPDFQGHALTPIVNI